MPIWQRIVFGKVVVRAAARIGPLPISLHGAHALLIFKQVSSRQEMYRLRYLELRCMQNCQG